MVNLSQTSQSVRKNQHTIQCSTIQNWYSVSVCHHSTLYHISTNEFMRFGKMEPVQIVKLVFRSWYLCQKKLLMSVHIPTGSIDHILCSSINTNSTNTNNKTNFIIQLNQAISNFKICITLKQCNQLIYLKDRRNFSRILKTPPNAQEVVSTSMNNTNTIMVHH